MRSRISLMVVLCLLAVSAGVPAAAETTPRETGRFQQTVDQLWTGLVAWISQYGLLADPDGSHTVVREAAPTVAPSEHSPRRRSETR